MKRIITGILICALLLTILVSPIAKTWSNTGITFINNDNDSHRVTIQLDVNGISYGQELLWKANTTGTNYEESAVVYCDGIAYISSCSTHGAGHDKLFAVDTVNGDLIWSTFIGPGYVGPIIDDNRVYIGTSSHGYDPTNEYIFCINRSDGTVIWSRNIYGGIAESIQYDEHQIYFTSDIIYALDKNNGGINWTYNMDDYSVTKPILKDNAFFTATSSGTMYKINVKDGSEIWSISLPDFSWDNSITADGNGHIFIAVYNDRSINAYNEDSGKLLWTYPLHGRSLSFNAYHDNVVYIADTSGYVYALDSSAGVLLWEKKIGNVIDISSPTLSGGLLFIGTRDLKDGAFFALDEKNGDIKWKYTIGASVTAPPSIADGMMLCGTDSWYMYAFDFGVGEGNWLLHRYDAYNTAYSPTGLTEWQFVSATCTTSKNITTCVITNTYDHYVRDVKLQLPDTINSNWYDINGLLLQYNSNYYILENISSGSILTLIITTDNTNQPKKPTISGTSSGLIGKEYPYMVTGVDPSNSDLSYYVDWGDGTFTGWTSPTPSNESVNVSHIWNEKGSYLIKAKTKNVQGIESQWSDSLPVTMPYSMKKPLQQFFELLFQRFTFISLLRHFIGF